MNNYDKCNLKHLMEMETLETRRKWDTKLCPNVLLGHVLFHLATGQRTGERKECCVLPNK